MLYGVKEGKTGELRCECGKLTCDKRGKHPYGGEGFMDRATVDLETIRIWLLLYPTRNYGILMGYRVVGVDEDIKPAKQKHGVLEMQCLEIDEGKQLPYTVTVLSGSGNGSQHRFFLKPAVPADTLDHRHNFNAVELLQRGTYVVAPGSRHISGNWYRFADECNPVEQEVAEMPDFLLAAFTKPALPVERTATPKDDVINMAFGAERPDDVVIKQLRRDRIAGPLFDGIRYTLKAGGRFDRSKDDYALCVKLAFYSSHHWSQYVRLFKMSGLYGAKKDKGYLEFTLDRAFRSNPTANWTQIHKKVKKKAKLGRPLSLVTQRVIDLYLQDVGLTAFAISIEVGCTPANVRKILSRHRNGFYADRKV